MTAAEPPARDEPAAFAPSERAALVAIAGLGCWLRCREVTGAFLFGDEMHSLRLLPLGYGEIVRTFDTVGSGLAWPLLQKLSFDVAGPSLLALRLPALLPALVTLLALAWVGRSLVGPAGALFATAVLAANTMHVFYAHFGRSYALVALLALLFVAGLSRLVAAPRPRPIDYVLTAIAGGALPWVHLATGSFVASVGASAVLAALVGGDRRARASAILATVVASLAIAAALHLPAWPQVMAFVAAKRSDEYPGSFGVVDVATVLAGGRAGALVLLVAVPLAAALSLRRHGAVRLPLVTAALAPLPLVFASEPFGDPYAYARYAVAALPAAALLLGELAAGIVRSTGASRSTPVLAAAMALAFYAAGPARLADDGPYANTYLRLVPLPAFDVPARLPAPYASLPPGATIIEAPALPNRSRQLYRNYYLQHRHPTVLGHLPQEGRAWPGPHVAVEPDADGLEDRAAYLFLHLDVAAEVADYWRFVFAKALPHAPSSPALMERQRQYGGGLARPTPELLAALVVRYGSPIHHDPRLAVFRLR